MIGYDLIENPLTYKQIQRKLRKQTNELEKVRNRLVKALGAEPFVCTDLDRIIADLDELEYNLESRTHA